MATAKTKPRLIALTGATGFVGGHILKAAVKAGSQVRTITRRPQNLRPGVE
ncbi:MAG: NAD-dependent epimerase/dehydratase family protein, partial [Sphingomonadales bacterium]